MTTITQEATPVHDPTREQAEAAARIRRRLRPLYVAAWFLGINFWVPVEKLFLSRIGFTAASIGLLAATYAAVVPFLEIPALLLGAYFALQSGTLDSIIYDVLAEETGHSDGFAKEIGRLRLWEGVALVSSALAGGGLAALTSPRVTYFLTIPFVVLSIGALSRFTEPRLHRAGDTLPLRSQVATTYRTIVQRGRLRPVIITMVLSALLLQMLLEFGPLWMVALAAPAILYGPQWAGLMSAVGLGGVLAGRITLTRPGILATVVAVMLACSLTLTTSHNPIVIIAAQVALALLLAAVGTLLTRLLHDEIPSSLRAGVSSGVGTLTWMAFLPFALAFGFLSKHSGVHAAAWMIVAANAATCACMLRLVLSRRPHAVTRPKSPPRTSDTLPSLAEAQC